MSDLIDKAEAKAALQAWLDRHNYPVNPTLFHALDALPARGVGVDVEEVARAIYDAMRFERKDKTPEWVKGGNSDAQVEARSTAARILAALAPTDAAHVNETPKSEHYAGDVLTAAQDDPECTCCGGTGITYQTERRCACQPTDAAQAREAALHPDAMLPEAIRLIRQEATRDHRQEVVTGLKHIALLLEQLIGEART